MKLLVVCPHFAPDVAPTGDVMTAIVEQFAALGHEVHVVTSLPWYLGHAIDEGWDHKLTQTERTPWGSITRLHPFPTDKANIPARAVAFGGFTLLATLSSVVRRTRPDVVFTMSPPLILGFAGWLASLRWRAPHVFNIQDVFPDVAIEVGAITNPKVIKVAQALERFLYKRSAAVTVLSEDLRDNLAHKLEGSNPQRVRVIPNFVDTGRISVGDRDTSYRAELGINDEVLVMYAGNLGYSQSVELMIAAARRFENRSDVVFVINGAGSAKAALLESGSGLSNLRFVGLQPRERLPEVLASADIHTVLLKRGLARSSVPSKLYSILAAGRAVVASVDPGTEVERAVRSAEAGLCVDPEDPEAFCAAVEQLLDDPQERLDMGVRGRTWVEKWASPQAIAAQYVALFEELIRT